MLRGDHVGVKRKVIGGPRFARFFFGCKECEVEAVTFVWGGSVLFYCDGLHGRQDADRMQATNFTLSQNSYKHYMYKAMYGHVVRMMQAWRVQA